MKALCLIPMHEGGEGPMTATEAWRGWQKLGAELNRRMDEASVKAVEPLVNRVAKLVEAEKESAAIRREGKS